MTAIAAPNASSASGSALVVLKSSGTAMPVQIPISRSKQPVAHAVSSLAVRAEYRESVIPFQSKSHFEIG